MNPETLEQPPLFIFLYNEIRRQIDEKQGAFQIEKPLLQYLAQKPSRQTYHDFLWDYVGDLHDKQGIAGNHEITEGNFVETHATAYTNEGDLLVIRKRPDGEDPQDFYVMKASLKDQSLQRLYVVEHEITHEHFPAQKYEETFIFNSSPLNPLESSGSIGSNNPFRDMLAERERADTYRRQKESLPRLVRTNQGGYYSEGGHRDTVLGEISALEDRRHLLLRYFGDIALLAMQESENFIETTAHSDTIEAA